MNLKKYTALENKVIEFITNNDICYLLFFNGSELSGNIQLLLKEYILLLNNGEEPNVWFVDREKLYEEITKLLGKNGNYLIQYSKKMQIEIIHIDDKFLTKYSNRVDEIKETLERKLENENNQIVHNLKINKKELEYLIKETNLSENKKTEYKDKIRQIREILFSFGVQL